MSLEQFFESDKIEWNMSVPWYLMASYRYYECDDPLLSDSQFDALAKGMLKHWNCIEHYHKHLITLDMLEAGSYVGSYPTIVQDASRSVNKNVFVKKVQNLVKNLY